MARLLDALDLAASPNIYRFGSRNELGSLLAEYVGVSRLHLVDEGAQDDDIIARSFWYCRDRGCPMILGPLDQTDEDLGSVAELPLFDRAYPRAGWSRSCLLCGTTRRILPCWHVGRYS